MSLSPSPHPGLVNFLMAFNDRSIDKRPNLAAQVLSLPSSFSPGVFVSYRKQRTECPTSSGSQLRFLAPVPHYLWLSIGMVSEGSSPGVTLTSPSCLLARFAWMSAGTSTPMLPLSKDHVRHPFAVCVSEPQDLRT